MTAIPAADIALYRRYDGDLDGLARSPCRNPGTSGTSWRLIDELRQRAFIVAMGRGSEQFRQEFEADLASHIPDEDARREFRQIVDSDLRAAQEPQGRSANSSGP